MKQLGCGGLTLAGCQVPTEFLYHSPSSTRQEEKSMIKGSWVEIRAGRSLSSHLQLQNRLNSGKLFIVNQKPDLGNKKKLNLKNTFLPPLPSSWAQLHSLFSLTPPPKQHNGQVIGVAVSSSRFLCCAFLLTLFPCSSMGPTHRDSPP